MLVRMNGRRALLFSKCYVARRIAHTCHLRQYRPDRSSLWYFGGSPRLRRAQMMLGFLTLMSLFLLSTAASAQNAEVVAAKFLSLVRISDTAALSRLFHYPPAMSEEERQKDAEAVSASLAWLLTQFGKPISIKPTKTA